MSMSVLTTTTRFCRSCSKLFPARECRFGRSGFSTSAVNCKDEDEIKSLKTNPYFGKYSQKISELQKTIPEEISRRISAFRNKTFDLLSSTPEELKPKVPTTHKSSFLKSRQLDDIVKVDLLNDKSTEEITEIWLRHHAVVKDGFGIVIPAEVFSLILKTSSEHPTFLLPLPREHGYEFFVSQAWGHEFHLTPLINYQAFKENAPECLALSHFSDFRLEKGVVLMQGEFNREVLNISEAVCLTNQLHRYYGELDTKRLKLLQRFTNAPSEFHHMDLIVELERMAK